jgi:CDP-6-deoxy-D-xylo-4-hexulose-3-dehydrase
MFFGGNLVRQPVFVQLRQDRPEAVRIVGDLAGPDQIMNQAIFLGTYPGLTKEMLDYELSVIKKYLKSL